MSETVRVRPVNLGRPGTPGFTLIELVAALALSGLAIIGAAQLVDQLADTRDRSALAANVQAHRANGLRLLRDLTFAAEAGLDSSQRFAGADREARFGSWCIAPSGWLERCDVTLRVVAERDSVSLVLMSDEASLLLWRGAATSELRYSSGGRWWRGWGASVALPSAIGVVSDRDTLVLRIAAGT